MWSFFVLVLAAQTLTPAGPWKEVDRVDDIVVEARPIKGSEFEEVRVTTTLPAPAATVLGWLWSKERSPGVTAREFLEDKPTERVLYEVVDAPVVQTRDYVLRSVRDDATSTLRFSTVTDPRRPPHADRVRIGRIVGSTAVVKDGTTRCRVIHTVYAEAGGDVPAWLARSGQRDNMVAFLKRLKARAAT